MGMEFPSLRGRYGRLIVKFVVVVVVLKVLEKGVMQQKGWKVVLGLEKQTWAKESNLVQNIWFF